MIIFKVVMRLETLFICLILIQNYGDPDSFLHAYLKEGALVNFFVYGSLVWDALLVALCSLRRVSEQPSCEKARAL